MLNTSTTFMPGWLLNDVLIALQALVEVGLAWHAEEDHVALAIQLLHHPLSTESARGQVIGADEIQAVAVGRRRSPS